MALIVDGHTMASPGIARRKPTHAACLDNAQSGRVDEDLNSSHDWRSRGIDHGGVLSDRRAERLGPDLR